MSRFVRTRHRKISIRDIVTPEVQADDSPTLDKQKIFLSELKGDLLVCRFIFTLEGRVNIYRRCCREP